MRRAVGEDAPPRVAELVGHRDQLRVLNDLERKGHVCGPGNTGHIAGGLGRIIDVPGLEVFSFLGERGGLIWNCAALDYALPRRHPQRTIVILEIPRRGAQHLPEAVEVGLAVGGARNAARRRLRQGWKRQEETPERKQDHRSLVHVASIIGLMAGAGKLHSETKVKSFFVSLRASRRLGYAIQSRGTSA